MLRQRVLSARARLRGAARIDLAVEEILERYHMRRYLKVKRTVRQVHSFGACQRSCRLCHAAVADSFCAFTAVATSESRSGLSVTTVIGCQLRVCLVQRLGLAARARV